ncbi:hypothetical protein BD311DRAFT_699672 [Dichomitus squalens]|uniref:Uncharacterized protein n=1 Tax=Dichomitus squalens TaxID=114155 RepID=A0A4Q9MGU0_9APHY|nr:hypothetical protein BD311DRAFT_699672 [Dichomitus squalens]TBU57560.1 hypothetical protein BD310DRAFT_928894 [Dichomitus squalens]
MITGFSMLDRLTSRTSTLAVEAFTTLEGVTLKNREKLGCDGLLRVLTWPVPAWVHTRAPGYGFRSGNPCMVYQVAAWLSVRR